METHTVRNGAKGRPDGSKTIAVGWYCLVAAAIFLMLSLRSGPTDDLVTMAAAGGSSGAQYADEVAFHYAEKYFLQIGAGAFFGLFLVFWSVGYIVKAISFLPGRGEVNVKA